MHIEVFHIDNSTGWAAAEFDAEGNQTSAADFQFHKRDAIKVARAMAGAVQPIRVFGRNGGLQRTLNKATEGE